MVLDLARMVAEFHVALRIVVALGGVEKRGQRDLGVHDDILAAGKANDDVGCQATVVAVRALLDVEVMALEHPRRFENAAELELAPLAADVGGAQGPREPGGFALQRHLRVRQGPKLLGQRGVGGGAIAIDVLELGVDLSESRSGCTSSSIAF